MLGISELNEMSAESQPVEVSFHRSQLQPGIQSRFPGSTGCWKPTNEVPSRVWLQLVNSAELRADDEIPGGFGSHRLICKGTDIEIGIDVSNINVDPLVFASFGQFDCSSYSLYINIECRTGERTNRRSFNKSSETDRAWSLQVQLQDCGIVHGGLQVWQLDIPWFLDSK